jgi:2'-5' RNA ligase
MQVLAVRDDGAQLITNGGEAAALITEDGVTFLRRDDIDITNDWRVAGTTDKVPPNLADVLGEHLTALDNDISLLPVVENDNDDVVAATEAHTGAMIALVPSAADAERLAHATGEPADELHLTLQYLGEGADYSDDERASLIEDVITRTRGIGPVQADGFAVSVFNPPGHVKPDGSSHDTCIVLGLSGDELPAVREFIGDALNPLGDRVPPQHDPWTPHVTLAYTNDTNIAPFLPKTGPVTFDKVRLAFAGDVYDIPLVDTEETGQISPNHIKNKDVPSSSGAEHTYVDSGTSVEFDLSPAEIELTCFVLGLTFNEFLTFNTFDKERDVNLPGGPGHQLRDYWVHGPGAAKIGWGTDGSMKRCMLELGKYVKDPGGLCAEYHHRATGEWPRGGNVPSEGDVVPFRFDPRQPRDEDGKWTDTPGGSTASNAVGFGRDMREDMTKEFTENSKQFMDDFINMSDDNPGGHWDVHMGLIGKRQGFDRLPQRVSRDKYEELIDEGAPTMSRGVIANEHKGRFAILGELTSGNYQPGHGIYGSGYYFSENHGVAQKYADSQGPNKGAVLDAVLDPNAKVIDFKDLEREIYKMKNHDSAKYHPTLITGLMSNPGHIAGLMGYDAIKIRNSDDGSGMRKPNGDEYDQYMVLNRGAMILPEDD